MKKLFAFGLLISLISTTFGQDLVNHRDSTGAPIYSTGRRIVVLPFKPADYKSDADGDLSLANNLGPSNVKQFFRSSFDSALCAQLSSRFNVIQLGADSPGYYKEDLTSFYNVSGTSYEAPQLFWTSPKPSTKLGVSDTKTRVLDFIGITAKSSKELTTVEGGTIRTNNPDTRYYRTTIGNANIFPYMADKYQADLFLFINMMEVKTRYDQCIDLENKNYQREFTIHYTVYDKNGKLVVGNVITLLYPSKSNNINAIIEKNFAVLSTEIAKTLP